MSAPSLVRTVCLALLLAALPACGSTDEPSANTTGHDAGPTSEAGEDALDSGVASDGSDDVWVDSAPDAPSEAADDVVASDAPSEASNDASVDAGVPLDGMGSISGPCGVLDDAEWNASIPFTFRNNIDFGTEGFVEAELSPGGAKMLADGNLNDGSLKSEIVAYEALYRCELAALLKTENEVDYLNPDGKKTDVLVEIDGRKVGVSITRATHFPTTDPYTVTEATVLLEKKLSDLSVSAANATTQDAWERSMLHVVAYDDQYADSIEAAWSQLDATMKADFILMITVTDGDDAFAY